MTMPFGNIMEQFQKAQESMQSIKDELKNSRVTADVGAGMISVEANGMGEALKVNISDEAYGEGKEVLEELFASAINELKQKLDDHKQEKMKQMMQALGLPPGMNIPFPPV